jgi:hypothetical protein
MTKSMISKLSFLMTLLLTFLFIFTTYSTGYAKENNIAIIVNGKTIDFPDAKPFSLDGRTLVPVRFVAEALGAEVSWKGKQQLVTLTKGSDVIKLTVGENKSLVNGVEKIFDSKAISKDGRTYVPLRFISESLGSIINWDSDTRTVTISSTGFLIGENPFRFIEAFLPGWHWGEWSEKADDDLIHSAKEYGISVLHIMLPDFETKLGVYDEISLKKLDHFLNTAEKEGVYVIVSFIQAFAISLDEQNPYYNPYGIEGLIKNPSLVNAYNKRISTLINRVNTVNNKIYKDDTSIMAWMICDEPITAPWNYANKQKPNVTPEQLKAWIDEKAQYIKKIDPNHLVTIHTHAAIDTLSNTDWINIFDVNALDFVLAEDADLRVLNYFPNHTYDSYSYKFFKLNKPIVFEYSFTSGLWGENEGVENTTSSNVHTLKGKINNDYSRQSELLKQAFIRSFDVGASGAGFQTWGTSLYNKVPDYDKDFNYNSKNIPISTMLKEVKIAVESKPDMSQFVKIYKK